MLTAMRNMLEKLKKRIRSFGVTRTAAAFLLVISIALTLAFIFSNSAKTPVRSNAQSSSFKETVEKIIPPDTELGALILNNIRKIAHFTEYGLLGIETSLLILSVAVGRKKRYKSAAGSLLFALTVAFVDETIQIFSKRAPSVSDMWIDVGGFFVYSLLTYLIAEITLSVIKLTLKVKKRHGEKTD